MQEATIYGIPLGKLTIREQYALMMRGHGLPHNKKLAEKALARFSK